MRIVTDYMEFDDEVKIIMDSYRLLRMGILCSMSLAGFFMPSEMDDVLDFCGSNKDLHVVSFLAPHFGVNRYHQRGVFFHLAEGCADPHLVYDGRINVNWEGEDFINETKEIINFCRNDLLRKRF